MIVELVVLFLKMMKTMGLVPPASGFVDLWLVYSVRMYGNLVCSPFTDGSLGVRQSVCCRSNPPAVNPKGCTFFSDTVFSCIGTKLPAFIFATLPRWELPKLRSKNGGQ